MKRALLPLWFIGGIVCTTTVANAQSLEPASIRSDQAEIAFGCRGRASSHIAAALRLRKPGRRGGLLYRRWIP